MLQRKVSEIIADFLNEGDENYKDLINNLSLIKTSSNICTYMFFLRFIVQLKGDVSILKAISKLFLKLQGREKIRGFCGEKLS